MPIGILFWVLFVIWILFGGHFVWSSKPEERRSVGSGYLMLVVLIGLLGWKSFGFIIQG